MLRVSICCKLISTHTDLIQWKYRTAHTSSVELDVFQTKVCVCVRLLSGTLIILSVSVRCVRVHLLSGTIINLFCGRRCMRACEVVRVRELTVWQCEYSLSQAVEVWVSHGFLCWDPFLSLKLKNSLVLVTITSLVTIYFVILSFIIFEEAFLTRKGSWPTRTS